MNVSLGASTIEGLSIYHKCLENERKSYLRKHFRNKIIHAGRAFKLNFFLTNNFKLASGVVGRTNANMKWSLGSQLHAHLYPTSIE